MIKKIFSIIKKICVAFLVLYGFNLIGSNINIIIPINYITIGALTLLGIPGLFGLIAMFFII